MIIRQSYPQNNYNCFLEKVYVPIKPYYSKHEKTINTLLHLARLVAFGALHSHLYFIKQQKVTFSSLWRSLVNVGLLLQNPENLKVRVGVDRMNE